MHEDIIFSSVEIVTEKAFEIYLAGTSYCDGSYRICRSNGYCYVFEYVESGRGVLRINDLEFEAEAGDVYIIPLGARQEYWSSKDDPWVKHWFNVGGSMVGDLLRDYQLNGTYLFKNYYPLKQVFLDSLDELKRAGITNANFVAPQIILKIILHLAKYRDYLCEKASFSPQAKKLQLYINENVFDPNLTLNDMSEHLGISLAQCNRIFRKDIGQSPYQYLLNLRISLAKELLANSIMKVKEISRHLGFSDEYYFSNIFKKKVGVSPNNFRKAVMKKSSLR